MSRKAISEPVRAAILTKSRRRCCLCFWLNGTDEVQKGQICHLDQNSENNAEDNLVFLCFDHHDDYDGTPRIAKGLREDEVRHWRDELYKEMQYRFKSDDSPEAQFLRTVAKVEHLMPELFKEFRQDLRQYPLFRKIVILNKGVGFSGNNFLFYFFEEHPQLEAKMDILVNHGLLSDTSRNHTSMYVLTEEFAEYLLKQPY